MHSKAGSGKVTFACWKDVPGSREWPGAGVGVEERLEGQLRGCQNIVIPNRFVTRRAQRNLSGDKRREVRLQGPSSPEGCFSHILSVFTISSFFPPFSSPFHPSAVPSSRPLFLSLAEHSLHPLFPVLKFKIFLFTAKGMTPLPRGWRALGPSASSAICALLRGLRGAPSWSERGESHDAG